MKTFRDFPCCRLKTPVAANTGLFSVGGRWTVALGLVFGLGDGDQCFSYLGTGSLTSRVITD